MSAISTRISTAAVLLHNMTGGNLPTEALQACQASAWAERFADVSYPTLIIHLSRQDVAYLVSDSIDAADVSEAVWPRPSYPDNMHGCM